MAKRVCTDVAEECKRAKISEDDKNVASNSGLNATEAAKPFDEDKG